MKVGVSTTPPEMVWATSGERLGLPAIRFDCRAGDLGLGIAEHAVAAAARREEIAELRGADIHRPGGAQLDIVIDLGVGAQFSRFLPARGGIAVIRPAGSVPVS